MRLFVSLLRVPVAVGLICFLSPAYAYSPITITTRTSLSDQSAADVQAFLASPGNWPKIVSSSVGVKSNEDVDQPLLVGKTVDEIFGLPPLLPLSVQWQCIKSIPPSTTSESTPRIPFARRQSQSSSAIPGRLEFFSPNGLSGVADNCKMQFDVESTSGDDKASATSVNLTMQYTPLSPLAILALPILTLDNTVALQFLLPAALRSQPELDKFRTLMGNLYGVAGLAHLADCLWGPSQLLTMAGAPMFGDLPLAGKGVALLWCGMGPLSFALSRVFGGKGYADLGLILYGLVEVGGAGLISWFYESSSGDTASMDPFMNAILVQGIVLAAWIYSASKPAQQQQ